MPNDIDWKARALRAELLLHNLTPGGSEFYANPERCAAWVRDRLANMQRLTVEAHRAKNEAIAKSGR